MKLTSKFLLILMFTIFSTFYCSKKSNLFTKLKAKSINKGDIMNYYTSKYDPMLELHNTFFDRCLKHLMSQSILDNDGFLMKGVDSVKEVFNKGMVFEPLQITELGITIKCENYLNKITTEGYILNKKQELKKIKTKLYNFNEENGDNNTPRIPKGRLQSERATSENSGIEVTVNGRKYSKSEYEAKLRKEGYSQSEIQSKISQIWGSSSSSSSSSSDSSSSSSESSSSSSHSSSSSTTISGGSSSSSSSSTTRLQIDFSGNLSVAEFERKIRREYPNLSNENIQKIVDQYREYRSSSGGSSSDSSSSTTTTTTSSTTYTFDSNGNLITSGGSSTGGNSSRDTSYSGSTISGMGAKFSIFYDRRIVKKDGKNYVEIGGVLHLIDEDGWIHGLSIDSQDKNINYNIAYENYFDMSCESMLTFMKNKYKQLLNDYNMNKDYVHNLQIENRRFIKTNKELTDKNAELSLRVNSCEQKIQDERVKKSTLYHNIKDIKTIRVDTRVKEMQETIIKLEKTINNYKIEITNLKQIIKVNIDNCNKDRKICHEGQDKKCKDEIIIIKEKCEKEKNDLNIIIQNKIKIINDINIKINNCRRELGTCKKDEIYIKWRKCEAEKIDIQIKITKAETNLSKCEKKLFNCDKLKIEINNSLTIIKNNYNTCKKDLEICNNKDCGKSDQCTTIINNIKHEQNIYITQIKNECKATEADLRQCRILSQKYFECEKKVIKIDNEWEIKCNNKVEDIRKKCDNEKNSLQIIINQKTTEITTITTEINTCKQERNQFEEENKTCKLEIITITKNTQTECEKIRQEEIQNCKAQLVVIKESLERCKNEREKLENECDSKCTRQVNTYKTEIQVHIQKYNSCTKDKDYAIGRKDYYKTEYLKYYGYYNDCIKTKAEQEEIIKKCQSNTNITVTCQQYYFNISSELSSCKSTNERYTKTITELRESETSWTKKYNNCNSSLELKDSECETKIHNQIEITIKKEQSTCETQITNINNTINVTINNYKTCKTDLLNCTNKISEYKSYKGYFEQYKDCSNSLMDYKTKVTLLEQKIDLCDKDKKNCIKDKDTCREDLKKCRKELIDNDIQLELNNCQSTVTSLKNIIRRYDLYISSTQSKFVLTISDMQSYYESRLRKLTNIIYKLRESVKSSTTIISTTTVTIEKNTSEILSKENQIKSLKERIKSLLKERREYMNKLDTLDCNSTTEIVEIKNKIVIIQNTVEEHYSEIFRVELLVKLYSEETARMKAEIEIYRQNEEYWKDLITRYSDVQTDQEEYIKKLKELLKEYQIKDKDGAVIDISIYIKDTSKDTIVLELKKQIANINTKIETLRISYQKDIKIIREECQKNDQECKNQINNYITEINENKQKCQTEIDIKIRNYTEKTQETLNYLKLQFQQQLNECKKACQNREDCLKDNNDVSYNFEIYKKHCLILIDKNTADDCKAIKEVRATYNEKCIMTALPSSGKDLTTFASSDFSDDRNSNMMRRLNAKE